MASSSVVVRLLFLLFLVVVQAEKRILEPVNEKVIAADSLIQPIVGTIHGSGFVTLNELVYSVDRHHFETSFYIDVVVSTLPNHNTIPKYTDSKEYWEVLGIGASGENNKFYTCCTELARDDGACSNDDDLGRIIVSDPSKLKTHAVIELSPGMMSSLEDNNTNIDYNSYKKGEWNGDHKNHQQKFKHGDMDKKWVQYHHPYRHRHHHGGNHTGIEKKGGYRHGNMAYFSYTTHAVVIIGNCNIPQKTTKASVDMKTTVPTLSISGGIIWISNVSLFDPSMLFPLFMTICHFVVLVWYRRRMAENHESRIQIEVWIHVILVLAFVSTLMDFVYLCAEAVFAEKEHLLLRIVTDFLNKASHIGSRGLYVVLAHGLGVTKTKLSRVTMIALLFLCAIIFFTKEAAEGMGDLSFLRRDNAWKTSSFNQERHFLLKLSFRLNWILALWIPMALMHTIRYLRLTEDEHALKLQRYWYLLSIYVIAILVTVSMVGLFRITGGFHRRFSSGKHVFFTMATFDKVNHVIYWMILTSIATLWKPTPEAPMYGYMHLTDNDDQNNNAAVTKTSDLELMESTAIIDTTTTTKKQKQKSLDSSMTTPMIDNNNELL